MVLLDINLQFLLLLFFYFTTSTCFRFLSPDQTSLQSRGMSEDVTFNWSIFLNFQVKCSVDSIPNPQQLIQSQHLNPLQANLHHSWKSLQCSFSFYKMRLSESAFSYFMMAPSKLPCTVTPEATLLHYAGLEKPADSWRR